MNVKGEVRKRDGKRDEVLACGRIGKQADDARGVRHKFQDGFDRISHDRHAGLQIQWQNL